MHYDFKEAFNRIGQQLDELTNERIAKLQRLSEEGKIDFAQLANETLNEMINSNIRVTVKVLEEYHQKLMRHLAEKGL
ncbi:hypothetical protein [Desulforamulus hydrothermalis]|uniref:Uncharacterized protein n=1 Tax=Desulforamulus hydrothermalis Lam5 = DSM 18033 TaxID=1121428 RepID=K8DYS8_9FIRM|nr:hypothetical protein [Desulforamulus hydrothermalis]CCO08107.1 conserved hypothetical protein [Desulforamulus hydrothermalis Lam5 = DSM 18033]SHG81863.1 hypothetical protein SAMN02745177_00441 [Desulforamulus hydrothermalis Lam5 = DSM 18033]